MKRLYLLSFTLLLLFTSARAGEIEDIAQLIKQGDAQKLSEYMAASVEYTANDEENVYSKKQATDALAQFFSAHRLTSLEILHKVTSGRKFVFGVVIYNSNNGVFRIAYTLDISTPKASLIELRIEPEKTK